MEKEKKNKLKTKIKGKGFSIYLDSEIKENNPLGYSFSIEPQRKCIFINGYYRYLDNETFSKFIRDLKEVIKFYEEFKNTKRKS